MGIITFERRAFIYTFNSNLLKIEFYRNPFMSSYKLIKRVNEASDVIRCSVRVSFKGIKVSILHYFVWCISRFIEMFSNTCQIQCLYAGSRYHTVWRNRFFLIVHSFIYGSILILLKVNTFLAENKYVSFVFSLSFWPNKRPAKTTNYYK